MERVTLPSDYEEIVVDEPGSPERMARTIGREAVHVAAREAKLTRWRNIILVRVEGKHGRADLIFRLRRDAAVEIGEQSLMFRQAIAV